MLLPVLHSAAQNPNREKLEAYRIGFFTKKLNLTSDEAEKFWPAFNEFQMQKNALQSDRREIIRNFNQNESSMNSKEITEAGDKLINTFTEENSVAVAFHKKLKEILPPEKVIRFYQAENQWRAQLLNQLQDNRPPQQRQNQRINPEF
jgi:hypothetical protein